MISMLARTAIPGYPALVGFDPAPTATGTQAS
jgi:hypothetical protein